MNLNFNPKNINIGRLLILGILWGLIEAFVGKWIKLWRPSLFGFIMPFIITCYILLAKRFLPMTGSIILTGIIAAVIKLFYSGMIFHGAFTAILIESTLSELTVVLIDFCFFAAALVGVLLELYSTFHPLLTRGILCQSTHFVHFKQWTVNLFGEGQGQQLADVNILILLIVLHVLIGILAAIAVWPIGKRINI